MTTSTGLRFSGIIANEIQNLKDIIGCYKHFEASYEASQMPVAKAQVQLNKIVARKHLSELEAELHAVYQVAREAGKERPAPEKPQWINYKFSPLEERALLLDRADKRYTIHE